MKLLNYTEDYLIQNATTAPSKIMPFSVTQKRLLFSLIARKKVKREFFNYLLVGLYELTDWREMDYCQMYYLIRLLLNL